VLGTGRIQYQVVMQYTVELNLCFSGSDFFIECRSGKGWKALFQFWISRAFVWTAKVPDSEGTVRVGIFHIFYLNLIPILLSQELFIFFNY